LSELENDSKATLDAKLNKLTESIEFVVQKTHMALEKYDKLDQSTEHFFDNQTPFKRIFEMLAHQLIDMHTLNEKPLDKEAERRFLNILKLISEQRNSSLKLKTYSFLMTELRNERVHESCRVEFLIALIRTMYFQIGLRYGKVTDGTLNDDEETRLRLWKNYVYEITNCYRATMENFFTYLKEDRFIELITEIQLFYE
jgi:hypothetical protein